MCIFAYGQTGSGKTYTMVLTLVLRIMVNFLSDRADSVVDYIIFSLLFSLSIYIFTFQSGPSTSKKDWGVNYRALNDLFDISLNRRNIFSYEVGVQMVEIYNEQVRDLLSNKIAQKRYPFDNIAWIFFVTFLIIMFSFIFCIHVIKIVKVILLFLNINKHLGFGVLLSLMDSFYLMQAYIQLNQHQMF